METKKYRFGPVVFAFVSPIPMYESPTYEAFRTAEEAPPDYTVKLIALPEDSPYGNAEPIRKSICADTITVEMNCRDIRNVSVGRLMYLIGAAELFVAHDAFILHASYVIREGQALLFSAPSGTGKSTQADFWHKCRNAEIVNGDRVIISRENGVFYANGAYVAGSSGILKNMKSPLGHVILLERGTECMVRNIPVPQKMKRLLCECSFDSQDCQQYGRMLELVSDLMNEVPILVYGCTNHQESVGKLEMYL